MVSTFSKIALCILGLTGSISFGATSAYQLGQEWASLTMCGLMYIVKTNGAPAFAIESSLRDYVLKTKSLRQVQEQKGFIQGAVAALQGMKIGLTTSIKRHDGTNELIAFNDVNDALKVSFLKYTGIELLSLLLNDPHVSTMHYAPGHVLFMELPWCDKGLSCSSWYDTYVAFARAALKGCNEIGVECKVTEDQVVNDICRAQYTRARNLPDCSMAGDLAIDLMYNEFGDKVAAFLSAAHMFEAD